MADNVVKLFGSAVEFESFGRNTLAYVRKVSSDDMNERFPQDEELPQGLDLWGLFAADGQPIALADEKDALFQSADELNLLTLGIQ